MGVTDYDEKRQLGGNLELDQHQLRALLGALSTLQLRSRWSHPGDTVECTYTVTDGTNTDVQLSAVNIANTGPRCWG